MANITQYNFVSFFKSIPNYYCYIESTLVNMHIANTVKYYYSNDYDLVHIV